MKRLVLPIFASVLCYSLSSFALSDIEISGEADMAAQVYTLPTGNRGDSQFVMPAFLLNLDVPLKESNLLVVSLEGGEEQDKNTKRFVVETREAYLDLVSLFKQLKVLRFGLIPQPWQEAQYEDWEYRFLGRAGYVMTEKYKYMNYSDMGMSFMAELPRDLGEWAFTLMNGEGRSQEEVGPHKDFSVFVRLQGAAWGLSMNYLRGSYDEFEEDLGLKERIQALLLYKHEDTWMVGLEYLNTRDPADVIDSLKMADAVDVTDLKGQSVQGQGASLYTQISTGPKAEIMFRCDYLLPVAKETEKSLTSYIAAFSYQLTEDVRTAFSYDYTAYGKNYAAWDRDTSRIEIAAQVLF
jgi:hypothetical protein